MSRRLDCIVIGHNEGDFEQHARAARDQADDTGLYEDVKTNSVILEGRRVRYMDLLNHGIRAVTGRDLGLNVFRLPHLGAHYLVSYMRRRGFAADVANSYRVDQSRLCAMLAEGPRSVAITTTYYVQDEPIREIVEFVRAHAPETLVIVGGPRIYSIASDHDVISQDYIFGHEIGADIYIADSQGEATLAAAVGALQTVDPAGLRSIPNLIVRAEGGSWTRTGRLAETNDMNGDAIDWRLFDPAEIRPSVSLRTARSCPFACSFCNYPTLAGNHVLMSLEMLERSLHDLKASGVEFINFIDDTFNVPLPRFKNMMRMMIRNSFGFRWSSFFRCSNADEEAIDLMGQAGCTSVFLGIESGDPRILGLMNKRATPNGYRWGMGRLHQAGIATFASLIVGFPGETAESVANTMELVEGTAPTFFNTQLYYHDRQSPIHKRAGEFDLRGGGYGWRHDGMTWQEASSWVQAMFRDIRSSTPLTLDGFSVWALIHLLEHGMTISQIQRFGEAARPMLVDGFDERPVDLDGENYRRLLAVIGEMRLRDIPSRDASPRPLCTPSA